MTKMRYEFIQPKRRDNEPYSKEHLVKLTQKYWREIRQNIIPPELQRFLNDNNLPVRLLLPTDSQDAKKQWRAKKSAKNSAKKNNSSR
jgi:hypothetical protein